jgi:proteasome lid subunit RPN8/RPN11
MTHNNPYEPLRLTPAVRDALIAHAVEAADRRPPVECCGVLASTRDDPTLVTESHRVENVAADPESRYELDPATTVRLVDRIEAGGGDVVGFYHSHPEGPAVPSATDRAQATWSGYVYAIVSPPATVRAYRYTGSDFAERPVQVESRE